MASRARLWRAGAAAFVAINFAGGVYAAATGEPMHAAVHAILLVLGIAVYSVFRIRPADAAGVPQETAERLKHLEESVDALAIGVERVGEAQRYQTKILDEKTKVAQQAPRQSGVPRKEEG
jgi:hypothetical protein